MRKFLRHLFLPHHTNNHRPKVLHIDSLLVVVLVLLVFNLSLRVVSKNFPDVLGYATDIRIDALLSETNGRREAMGLTKLTLNQQLSQAAAAKANDMFKNNYWAHNSPLGKTPWDFIVGSGYHYTLAGENLAKNFSDSQGVVNAWMNSPSHRDNIIKPGYRDIGFAVVNGVLNGEETTLVVQMFGTSAIPVTEPVAKTPIIPQLAINTEAAPVVKSETTTVPVVAAQPFESVFAAVNKNPLINLPTVTRDVVFLFVGLLLGVLAVDAVLAKRHNLVRLTGHNVAHMLFLGAFLIGFAAITRGSLL